MGVYMDGNLVSESAGCLVRSSQKLVKRSGFSASEAIVLIGHQAGCDQCCHNCRLRNSKGSCSLTDIPEELTDLELIEVPHSYGDNLSVKLWLSEDQYAILATIGRGSVKHGLMWIFAQEVQGTDGINIDVEALEPIKGVGKVISLKDSEYLWFFNHVSGSSSVSHLARHLLSEDVGQHL